MRENRLMLWYVLLNEEIDKCCRDSAVLNSLGRNEDANCMNEVVRELIGSIVLIRRAEAN